MIERTLFQPDHQAFADSFRRFIEKEVTPPHADWEDQGYVAREVWSQAGTNGFLCMSLPEEYGGAGADKLSVQLHRFHTWPECQRGRWSLFW